MDHKVLIVDDEANVLSSLERALRKENYQVLTAQSGSQALELLEGHKVSVILSDINMPEMDGIEFLVHAIDISPDSIKMILSGHSDLDLVVDSINKGQVWRYLTKPWQAEDVRIAIGNAIGLYELRAEKVSLYQQLEIKNKQLQQWSSKLESMVERRTEHIQNELLLMSSLIDGKSLEQFSMVMLPLLRDLFAAEDAYVLSIADSCGFGSSGRIIGNDAFLCHQLKCIHDDTCVRTESDYIIIPIVNGGIVLGGLFVKGYKIPLETVSSDYESYVALTSIAMLYNAMSVNSNGILGNIDQMLQEL